MKIALIIIGASVVFFLIVGMAVGMVAMGIQRQESQADLLRTRARADRVQAEAEAETRAVREALDEERNQRDLARHQLAALSAELDEARERTAATVKERETLEAEWSKLQAEVARVAAGTKDLGQHNQSMAAEIDQLRGQLDEALKETRAAVERENAAVAEKTRLGDELLNTKENLAATERQLVVTQEKLEATELELLRLSELVPEAAGIREPVPIITAKVTAVDRKVNIVLLSVGRDDKVKVGYKFTVYRGDQYVGTVVVDKVGKDYAAGYSEKGLEQSPIKVGDDATTRF